MRDPKRIKLITDVLCRLWSKPENQNLRLGQLLMNIHYNNKFDNDMFYTEDIEWLEMFMEECNKEYASQSFLEEIKITADVTSEDLLEALDTIRDKK